eukprot:2379904-Rhodomonas_salina.3
MRETATHAASKSGSSAHTCTPCTRLPCQSSLIRAPRISAITDLVPSSISGSISVAAQRSWTELASWLGEMRQVVETGTHVCRRLVHRDTLAERKIPFKVELLLLLLLT